MTYWSFLKVFCMSSENMLCKRFGRESFLVGIKNIIQENISQGKSISKHNLKKNSKFFPNKFFLDEVISSLSPSLCLSVSLSTIANQAQVLLSNIKTNSHEIATNGPKNPSGTHFNNLHP